MRALRLAISAALKRRRRLLQGILPLLLLASLVVALAISGVRSETPARPVPITQLLDLAQQH